MSQESEEQKPISIQEAVSILQSHVQSLEEQSSNNQEISSLFNLGDLRNAISALTDEVI